jgi:hypothetical protein
MSTNAHQEARRLSTSRNSGPGSEAAKQEVRGIAAAQQQAQGQQSQSQQAQGQGQYGMVGVGGSAVVDEPVGGARDMGPTAVPRRNSICASDRLAWVFFFSSIRVNILRDHDDDDDDEVLT